MRSWVVVAVVSFLLSIGVPRVPTAFADESPPGQVTPAVASSPADAQDRCAALLDVAVIISIISINVGLLLPAVENIREAAARCMAH